MADEPKSTTTAGVKKAVIAAVAVVAVGSVVYGATGRGSGSHGGNSASTQDGSVPSDAASQRLAGDLEKVAAVEEQYFSQYGSYTSDLNLIDQTVGSLTGSDAISIPVADSGTFCLRGEATDAPRFLWLKSGGGVTTQPCAELNFSHPGG